MLANLWMWWLMAVLGLATGGFCTVLVHRLPRMIEQGWDGAPGDPAPSFHLAKPGSHCPHCEHPLRWPERLPLWGYLHARGLCRYCQAPIGWHYPAMELAVMGVFVLMLAIQPTTERALLWAGFATVLLTLAVIDARTTWLPDELTQPLLWSGLLASALAWTDLALPDAVYGAVAGYLSLWALNGAFMLWRGQVGMGHGDFKLLAALGAWFGPAALPQMALAASVSALLVAGWGLLRQRPQSRMAFGPYLALAGAWQMLTAAMQWPGL